MQHTKMQTWERGRGVAMACGTGACALAAAAIKAGFCDKDTDVTVCLEVGDLRINVLADNTAMMTGLVKKISECEVDEV